MKQQLFENVSKVTVFISVKLKNNFFLKKINDCT